MDSLWVRWTASIGAVNKLASRVIQPPKLFACLNSAIVDVESAGSMLEDVRGDGVLDGFLGKNPMFRGRF